MRITTPDSTALRPSMLAMPVGRLLELPTEEWSDGKAVGPSGCSAGECNHAPPVTRFEEARWKLVEAALDRALPDALAATFARDRIPGTPVIAETSPNPIAPEKISKWVGTLLSIADAAGGTDAGAARQQRNYSLSHRRLRDVAPRRDRSLSSSDRQWLQSTLDAMRESGLDEPESQRLLPLEKPQIQIDSPPAGAGRSRPRVHDPLEGRLGAADLQCWRRIRDRVATPHHELDTKSKWSLHHCLRGWFDRAAHINQGRR